MSIVWQPGTLVASLAVAGSLFGSICLQAACRSNDATTVETSSGGGDGGVSAFTCDDECETKAEECGDSAATCVQVCTGTISQIVLDCVLGLDCGASQDEVDACLAEAPTSSSSSSSGGSSSGSAIDAGSDAASGPCAAFGGDCSTAACCTDSVHIDVTCNANNDGQQHSECCVAAGNPCTFATDCCGYEAAADDVKVLFSCNGVCSIP